MREGAFKQRHRQMLNEKMQELTGMERTYYRSHYVCYAAAAWGS